MGGTAVQAGPIYQSSEAGPNTVLAQRTVLATRLEVQKATDHTHEAQHGMYICEGPGRGPFMANPGAYEGMHWISRRPDDYNMGHAGAERIELETLGGISGAASAR